MYVLFLSDEYLPESTRAHAKMMHDLALKFLHHGHKPVLLTPGSIYQSKALKREFIDGIHIWRFRTFNFRVNNKFLRAVYELLMPIFALIALLGSQQKVDLKFDIIINYSPSIFFAPVARYFRKKDTFVFLVLRDFFPQWAVDQGLISKNSPITYFFNYVARVNYRSSNVIAVQSLANHYVFKDIYKEPADVRVLMNWSSQNSLSSFNSERNQQIRNELNLSIDKVILLYGGNIGNAQDMMNIARLAQNLQKYKKAHIVLIGQGNEYEMIKHFIKVNKIKNMTLLPSVSQNKYREYLASADIGLFSLAKTHTSHNFPGKLLGYMAEKKPLLGSVNKGNDVIQMIVKSKSGFVTINGNDKKFLKNAINLINNKTLRREMGLNANNLLKTDFSVDKAYKVIYESFLSYGSKT